MADQFLNIVIYSTLAGVSTVLGIYLVLKKERWALKHSAILISFSGGVVLTAAFVNILPEAMEINSQSLVYVLITLIVFYIAEHAMMIHSCREGDCESHSMGWLGFMGIGFHSLLDGVAIGAGFEASFSLGIVATIGVLLHELPEGITITSILLHTGFSKKNTLLLSWVVAIATPVGAIGSYFFLKDISKEFLGFFLAIAAGSFIYIGASDLLPETHKNSSRKNIVAVLSGALLIYLVGNLIGGH
ncbi:MAG: ZIP family metal transporter [Deltaproteobacteria bacterium]|nr:ZIP family metal transporter [Deltaproteobacteria bacterium]